MNDLVPLHLLDSGESARIELLSGHAGEVQRFEELGLRRGTEVEMVQRGSPCIIRYSAGKVCFRQSDTFHVFVRPGGPL